MESTDQNQATSGSPELSHAGAVIAEPRPGKTLANVALGLGLWAAVGSLLFVIEWNSPFYVGLPCAIAGAGFFVAPFGIIMSTVALVLRFRRPQRIGGGRRALAGLLMSLMGVGWFGLICWSRAMQYGPWGALRQMDARSRLEELGSALGTYAGEHEGDYPPELQVLVELELRMSHRQLKVGWRLGDSYVSQPSFAEQSSRFPAGRPGTLPAAITAGIP